MFALIPNHLLKTTQVKLVNRSAISLLVKMKINSVIFLKHASSLVNKLGYKIMNIDTTFICEQPKISSYNIKMKKNIATTLKIDLERISIKATTTEKLGFCGREEGIACLTTVGLFRHE